MKNYLTAAEVIELLPISRATWYNGVKSGRYPKPSLSLGPKKQWWHYDDIKHLIPKE